MTLAGLLARIEAWLQGWPEGLLTLALLVLAAMSVWVALTGSALTKAVTVAWAVIP